MWLNLLIILGTCVGGVVFGFFVYWIIIKIQKTLRTNQSNSMKGEGQTPSTITEDITDPSLEQPLNEADYSSDNKRETDTETEDNDWLNNGVPEASASTIKKEDDDWLNAELEEVPTNVQKQQDDDWLNAVNNQPLETVDEPSLNPVTTNHPEIQIKQDGFIINITVTASPKQDTKLEQTVINLKINVSPQDSGRTKGEHYNIEITTDDSSPSDQSLQDIINVEPVEESVNQSHTLLDEISIRPVESQVTQSRALMDEITVKPIESPVTQSRALMDEITVKPIESPVTQSRALMDEITVKPIESPVTQSRALMDEITVKPIESPVTQSPRPIDQISIQPVESQVTNSHALMDEITVKPIESPVTQSRALMDEITVKPVESPVTQSRALMDEISIKPSPGPINIEYELLDDLITKSALYLKKKAKPFRDASITNPVESSVKKTEQVDNTSINEISEIFKLKGDTAITNPVESPLEKAEQVNTISVNEISEIFKLKGDASITNPVESPLEKAEQVNTISVNEISEIQNQTADLKQATIGSVTTGTRRSSIVSLNIPITAPLKVLLLGLGHLIAMVIAELIISSIYPAVGIVIYFIILFSLIVNGILTEDKSQREFYTSLGLAPLIRIILLAIPSISLISQYLWYIVASIPVIAGIISISRSSNLSANDIGLNLNKLFIQLLVAITGIGLAMVDYLILKPVAWNSSLTIQATLFPAIVLLIFTGLIEELSFRGVMQRASVVLGSYGWIFIAMVYGALQIWQGSIIHCIFSFGVGLFFGWIVKKTGSILGVGTAHGLINIGLYLVLPHIF